MFAELMFSPLEAILNRGLKQSGAAQALATSLEGRVLGLTMEGTPFDLRIKATAGRLSVSLPDGAAPDACISGGPLSLARLLRDDPQAAVRDGAVRMTGDTGIDDQFRELLRLAAPDFEAELTRLVGEPIAREVGDAGRAFERWSRESGDMLARRMSDYLQKDSGVLPTAEVSIVITNVDPEGLEQDLLLKVQGEYGPNWCEGAIEVLYDSVNKTVTVWTFRLDTLEWYAYPSIPVTFANGDLLGAHALDTGDVIILKNNKEVGRITLNADDQAFLNPRGGHIGLWFIDSRCAFLDNFGGGNVYIP